tara:strand:+ start:11140 stop:11448 length:309 start_codon:yes stop_codon:yes gene_type:complete
VIEHTVTFLLKHSPGSPEEQTFLDAASALADIPGVRDFAIRRQTNSKNNHTFGIAMRFESEAEYQSYTAHSDHTDFVQKYWLSEVVDFQEADFEPLVAHHES